MIRVAAVTPELMRAIEPQARQQIVTPILADDASIRALAWSGPCWVALADGQPVAAGGLIILGRPTPLAWALLGREVRRHLPAIFQLIRRFFRAFDGPIEAAIEADFPAARRWARLLGFRRVGPWPVPPMETGHPIDRWVR